MEQYARTNNEGEMVLDYDLLDIAARTNFLQQAELEAAAIELDLTDEDFSNAEKAEAINDAAKLAADNAFAYVDAEVDTDTKQMFIERIISKLAERYEVEVA